MITTHLPILQVVIPLMAAPLCLLLRRSRLCWALSLAVSAIALMIALLLLGRVLSEGPISYALGNWSPPWGIEYRVDIVNAFMLIIISAIGTVVQIFAPRSVSHEILPSKHVLFYTLYLLFLSGLLGVTITGDTFNVYVFLEISALSTYALIALGRDRRALTAAFRYLVLGSIGATFILIGIGLMYMMTGTLNMADMAQRLQPMLDSRTALAALAFLGVGLTLKLALFPLHIWLPDAYTHAPTVVTVLMGVVTKVWIYVFLRFAFTIWGQEFVFTEMNLQDLLVPLSLIGMLAASTAAIFQRNVKRMLAYSSVAQIGYMMLGVSFVSQTGLSGTIVHLFNHALLKAALFMALGAMLLRVGSPLLDDLRGIGRQMPWTMAAFVLGGLSLIGVPLTVGFISKWYFILAALEKGWWLVASLILLTSLLAVVYIWRVVEVAYFQQPDPNSAPVKEAPLSMQLSIWVLITGTLFFGISTKWTAGLAERAAAWLLGGGP